MSNAPSNLRRLFRNGDLWLVGGLFGTILLLIIPIPAFLLDLLLVVSMALALLILLVIIYLREPADFTGFPTMLLFVTLFRLSLNVASTRLILLDGYAGHIIDAFGNFVVRSNYVVGMVIFLILVLINFIVITKGAGRIAEVAARFTLDAMPGKQMAIDAELNAGLINETEARLRRRSVEQEADFYGAMDGASKFVRGDAIAAVLITLINIIGGFGVGVMQMGMSVTESLQRFTILSIGDGLVAQVPALITSVASGILVTRAAAKDNLGQELTAQLFYYPRAITILSAMLGVMSLVPGLPTVPFMVMAIAAGTMAYMLKRHGVPSHGEMPSLTTDTTPKTSTTHPVAGTIGSGGEKLESLLPLDTLQIELGYALVPLADARRGGDLLDRVTGIRRKFAQEMGIVVPPIRLRDNLQLNPNHYRFLLKGNEIASGDLMANHWLAMNATNSKVTLRGTPTVEPVFKLPATWITDVERKNAELANYTVVDAPSVLVTHLSETIKHHAHEILTRQDVQGLLDNLKQTHPAIVNELIPSLVTVGQLQRILRNLLAEGVSIRDLASILEKVGDQAAITKNPDELSEHARRALATQIAKPFQTTEGALKAITLDPKLEQEIAKGLHTTPTDVSLVIEPGLARHVVETLSKHIQQMSAGGTPPLVLCAPQIRLALRRFFSATFSEIAVLSYHEIPPRMMVQNVAMVTYPA